jgi:hypothetical protein
MSKGGYLSCVFGFFLYFVIIGKKLKFILSISLLLFCLFLFIPIDLINIFLEKRIFVSSDRLQILIALISNDKLFFTDFMLGFGHNSYSSLSNYTYNNDPNAHNSFLNLFIQYGFLSILWIIYFLIFFIYAVNITNKDCRALALSVVTANMIFISTNNGLEFPYFLISIYLVLTYSLKLDEQLCNR